MLSRNWIVYICSGGCGYVERARMWDSPPFGRDGSLRCPDCGAGVWDYDYLTSIEAREVVDYGYSTVERVSRV